MLILWSNNRNDASVGTWLAYLLPVAIILGSFSNPTVDYNIAAVFSSGLLGAAVSLVLHLQNCKGPAVPKFSPLFLIPALITALLLHFICEKGFSSFKILWSEPINNWKSLQVSFSACLLVCFQPYL